MQHVKNSSDSKIKPDAAANRAQRDGGYLLVAILFMLAIIVITMTIEAPRLVQQIKRDREEEMIHRGTEYARAVKKYYKKFGRYPANLDQLDNTNQIRFLRQHYKDPLTKDGKWKLLNYTDIQSVLLNNGSGAPGVPAGSLGTQGGQNLGQPASSLNSSPFGSTASSGSPNTSQQQPQAVNPNGIFGNGQQGSTTGVNAVTSGQSSSGDTSQGNAAQGANGQGTSPFANTFNVGSNGNNQNAASPNGTSSPTGASNSPFGQSNSANQAFGGGAIVGVASLDKDKTIRIFNKKKTYNEWMFIYDPTQDRNNVLLRGPYQPLVLGGAQGQMTGTPANQLNGQQSPFGQQNNNGMGQSNGGFGQTGNGGLNQPQPPSSQPQQ